MQYEGYEFYLKLTDQVISFMKKELIDSKFTDKELRHILLSTLTNITYEFIHMMTKNRNEYNCLVNEFHSHLLTCYEQIHKKEQEECKKKSAH